MGVVYKAFDSAYGRDVAVKVLLQDNSEEAEANPLDRFRREGADLAEMSHPNVVRSYEVGDHAGTHYIVMEYVDGGNLRDYVRDCGGDLEAIARAYMAICLGLDHIHSQGIVHRDVKPSNILFSQGEPKITDFGISRRVSTPSELTRSGTILGTSSYVAPEQIVNAKGVNPSADLYALGVCLFESLTGRLPFTRDSDYALLRAHLSEIPPAPSAFRPDVPPALDNIVAKLLGKSPSQRPADAMAAANMFGAYLGIRPDTRSGVQKQPETTFYDMTEGEGDGKHLDVLARLGHEIWTPMNGIIGMTRLALGSDLSAEQRQYLQSVESSAEQLVEVLSTAMDFSRLRAGVMTLQPVLVDIRQLLETVLKPYVLEAHARDLELSLQVDPLVPDTVLLDPARARQLFGYLLSNALKFTERGTISLSVTRESGDANTACLHFAVADSGKGLLPGAEDLVFRPFYQEDASVSRASGGLGLGLSIVWELVTMMGGRVWADSVRGRGTVIHIEMELGIGGPIEETMSRGRLGRLKVLLVQPEDDALAALMRRWGVEVMEAPNEQVGSVVIDASRGASRPFDLVIARTDRSGIPLAARYQGGPEAFLLLLSDVQEGQAEAVRKLGVEALPLHPLNPTDLWSSLLKTLRKEPRGRQKEVGPLRILVAEDNLVNQTLARVMLESRGHEVTIAENGLVVLEKIKAEPFDLILMDLQMPQLDGLEATERIRAEEASTNRHLPIIALTAHGDPGACIAAGMDAFLKRPLDEGELMQAISRVMERASRLPSAPQAPVQTEGSPGEPAGPDNRPEAPAQATPSMAAGQANRPEGPSQAAQATPSTAAGQTASPGPATASEAPTLAGSHPLPPSLLDDRPTVVHQRPKVAPVFADKPTGEFAVFEHFPEADRKASSSPANGDPVAAATDGEAENSPTQVEPAVEVEAIDEAALLSRLGNNPTSVRRLVDVFMMVYPQQLQDVRDAIERGEAEALHRAAHTAKGSLMGFSAARAAEAAHGLITLGQAGALGEARQGLERLVVETEKVAAALSDLKARFSES